MAEKEAKNEPGSAIKLNKDSLMNRKSSQKSLNENDKAPPQIGEGTIELMAIEKIMDEEIVASDQVQSGGLNRPSLSTRWLKQVKYENFMECARKMWD